MLKILLVSTTTLLFTPVLAAQNQGWMAGIGSWSCQELNNTLSGASPNKKALGHSMLVAWIQGYWTGLNLPFEKNKLNVKNVAADYDAVADTIVGYCQHAPGDKLIITWMMKNFLLLPDFKEK